MVQVNNEPVIELLIDEWRHLGELGGQLTETDWKTPSECPGWTVQDLLAHIVGTECSLAGIAVPEASEAVTAAPHVRNEIGARNEAWIDSMRPLSGAQVLERFRAITAERSAALRAMTEAELDVVGWSPIGQVPYRVYMEIRLLDNWVHEQDIRWALGRPGHQSGPIVERALARFVMAMPMIVGKKAGAPDGSSVVFDLTGASARTIAIGVTAGRAAVVDAAPSDPTARITMPMETWQRLALGRCEPASIPAATIAYTGDRSLGERVVASLVFMI